MAKKTTKVTKKKVKAKKVGKKTVTKKKKKPSPSLKVLFAEIDDLKSKVLDKEIELMEIEDDLRQLQHNAKMDEIIYDRLKQELLGYKVASIVFATVAAVACVWNTLS